MECPVGKWGPDVPLFPRPQKLAVVSCYFNPCGYRRPRENYDRFAAGIQAAGVDLWTAELAYDDDPFDLPAAQLQIRGTRERNLLWQKERLLNLLIERLPLDVDAIAWVDADVLFEDPEWHVKTLDALASNHVVQPWERMLFLELDGTVSHERQSCGWYYRHKNADHNNLSLAHPGFAWAARAEWVKRYGLYEAMVTGGGDSMMVPGFTDCYLHIVESLNSNWLHHVRQWSRAVYRDVSGLFGYVPGDIRHIYHGDRSRRMYIDRWHCVRDGGFDPATDLTNDDTGLLAWTDYAIREKSNMVGWVQHYFSLRREDD